MLKFLIFSTIFAVSKNISANRYLDTFSFINKPGSDTVVFNDLVISKKPSGDTTVIKIKEREFLFINKNGNIEIRMNKDGDKEKDKESKTKKLDQQDSTATDVTPKSEKPGIIDENLDSEKRKSKIFSKSSNKGKWDGFEWGFNNFVDKNFSITRDDSISFMDLNTNRSWNININFAHITLPVFKNLYIVSGLGLEYNNYFFDNKNNIIKDNGYIRPMDLSTFNLEKSKLTTLFLRAPFIFEFDFNTNNKKSPFLQTGILLGFKLSSHTKYVYSENGNRKKIKDHDDFNLNWLRYGIIARAGYNDIAIYMTYYPTRFFERGKGPELYPINIGLSFLID